jgi:hypothetical protein
MIKTATVVNVSHSNFINDADNHVLGTELKAV